MLIFCQRSACLLYSAVQVAVKKSFSFGTENEFVMGQDTHVGAAIQAALRYHLLSIAFHVQLKAACTGDLHRREVVPAEQASTCAGCHKPCNRAESCASAWDPGLNVHGSRRRPLKRRKVAHGGGLVAPYEGAAADEPVWISEEAMQEDECTSAPQPRTPGKAPNAEGPAADRAATAPDAAAVGGNGTPVPGLASPQSRSAAQQAAAAAAERRLAAASGAAPLAAPPANGAAAANTGFAAVGAAAGGSGDGDAGAPTDLQWEDATMGPPAASVPKLLPNSSLAGGKGLPNGVAGRPSTPAQVREIRQPYLVSVRLHSGSPRLANRSIHGASAWLQTACLAHSAAWPSRSEHRSSSLRSLIMCSSSWPRRATRCRTASRTATRQLRRLRRLRTWQCGSRQRRRRRSPSICLQPRRPWMCVKQCMGFRRLMAWCCAYAAHLCSAPGRTQVGQGADCTGQAASARQHSQPHPQPAPRHFMAARLRTQFFFINPESQYLSLSQPLQGDARSQPDGNAPAEPGVADGGATRDGGAVRDGGGAAEPLYTLKRSARSGETRYSKGAEASATGLAGPPWCENQKLCRAAGACDRTLLLVSRGRGGGGAAPVPAWTGQAPMLWTYAHALFTAGGCLETDTV